MRHDGRSEGQLRPISVEVGQNCHAEGSCLITWGRTKVYVTATVEERVPLFLRGQGQGWVTAEYSMLPRATHSRTTREIAKLKPNGRSQEISRLIGRSLRNVIDLSKLGERQIVIDCDVLQADGGTRCASITAGWIALHQAVQRLISERKVTESVLCSQLAAVSVGKVADSLVLDLDYVEDSNADVDLNVVMDGHGGLIELQGTGERTTFSRDQLNQMLDYASAGLEQIMDQQRKVTGWRREQ